MNKFIEDIKNSKKCPEASSLHTPCDACDYKDCEECTPVLLANNLKNIGYGKLEPMDCGVSFRGVKTAILLFDNDKYVNLDAEFLATLDNCNYIKINDIVFRKEAK